MLLCFIGRQTWEVVSWHKLSLSANTEIAKPDNYQPLYNTTDASLNRDECFFSAGRFHLDEIDEIKLKVIFLKSRNLKTFEQKKNTYQPQLPLLFFIESVSFVLRRINFPVTIFIETNLNLSSQSFKYYRSQNLWWPYPNRKSSKFKNYLVARMKHEHCW